MDLKEILEQIVADPQQHAKWLNTLSFMENAGARKISASEDKEKVNLIILKHAAEEHRHAYYLKKQIAKIGEELCENYENQYLLAPKASKYYLNNLDVQVCKYLKKELSLKGAELRFAAYLLVTYAIEVRADDLYPIYQDILTSTASKVMVKSIILEEEGHLEEMINQLKIFFPVWRKHAEIAVNIEHQLFEYWMTQLVHELNLEVID
jgi:bacterioferritin (cytochrome b1)